jgi:hypothetical protein
MFEIDANPQSLMATPETVLPRTRPVRQASKPAIRSEMKIVDQERGTWAMLSLRTEIYLDVRCQNGPYCLYLLIKLNGMERQLYSTLGRSYIDSLAREIRSSPTRYYDRNQPIEIQKLVGIAIGNS